MDRGPLDQASQRCAIEGAEEGEVLLHPSWIESDGAPRGDERRATSGPWIPGSGIPRVCLLGAGAHVHMLLV